MPAARTRSRRSRSVASRPVCCPACDREVDDRSVFCPFCGLHLRSTRDEGRTTELSQDRVAARAESAPELRPCPWCGAPNSPARVLCGRCGADLAEGGADAPPAPSSDFVAEPRGRRRSQRRWPLVVGVLAAVVVGTVFGVLVYLQVGPFREAEPVAQPTFDEEAYPERPERLTVASVSASSTLPSEGDASYEPAMAADGDISTAWNEGAPGAGDGESLTFHLDERSWVEEIVIWNGDQEDERAFRANARASTVLLAFDEDGPRFEVDLDPGTGPQVVDLPDPVLTRRVTLRALEVVPDDRYDDLAISEVEILGWPAVESRAQL